MGNKKSLEHSAIRRENQKVGRAIQEYHLNVEGDIFLIGPSIAKDFIIIPKPLAHRLKYHPHKFKQAAIHNGLVSQPYYAYIDYLISFGKNRQAPFFHALASVNISGYINNKPYFKCLWNRCKALFQDAQEFDFNKLALGQPMVEPIGEDKLDIIRPL